ncbi:Y-family DNA polymerase [Salinimonas marina]|uniref:Y-family DNA polymerase n=1 Tax=Salinimonas marina TaxID=2785918 RepID=A0A7S9DWZ2_9ALTE|nr:Y-family DNA polymerase [Salinimonas marina]QPG05488.1 Y-family DNA polymerase [Salinimonas marina]
MSIALIDATSMYASAEKIFDPTIRKRPVIVLSNNDGAIVAMCPLAKRLGESLGIKKFAPYFMHAKAAKQAGFVVRSSNYELYADISQRMMDTCSQFGETHIYSIDECFMRFPEHYNMAMLEALGHTIRKTIWRQVRLPVGVGFGPSLTLAKAANHASKKLPGAMGVACLNNENTRHRVLTQMQCTDIWGIGRRLGKHLNTMGIANAWQLSQQCPALMRSRFSVLVENTVRELSGERRFSWDEQRAAKKEIYSTRSFGQRVSDKQLLHRSLIGHAEVASRKLRQQGSLSGAMMIFAASSPHDTQPFYKKSVMHRFAMPTADTRQMLKAVAASVETVFKPGVEYYKSGVGLIDLVAETHHQGDLFAQSDDDSALMSTLDKINQRFGRNSLNFASKGSQTGFAMRRDFLSACPTTRWQEIPTIKC